MTMEIVFKAVPGGQRSVTGLEDAAQTGSRSCTCEGSEEQGVC